MCFVQDPSIFKLVPHELDVGTTYEFRVDVTDSVGFSSFATQVKWNRTSSDPPGPEPKLRNEKVIKPKPT